MKIAPPSRLRPLMLAASLALFPLAAFADEAPRANAYTQPHVLRFSDAEDISTLNPVLANENTPQLLGRLAMAWLFRYDRSNRPEPELATVVPSERNGGISHDGKTITYHLRRGVRWSDGLPFDADDVVFSFGVMNNPANNVVSRDGFELIEKIDEPDKYTVAVHLRRPYASFASTFFGTGGGDPCLLPKHLLGGLANINQAAYNDLPVGIGPFRFKAWRRGDAVELEANPYYWRGLPKLHTVVFKIVPDRNTAFTQLQTGELDLWLPVPGSYYARLGTLPNISSIRQPGFIINQLTFNAARPALRERAVRQALRLAIDRTSLRDKVAHGLGILQEAYVPVAYPGAPRLPFIAYDIAKANALLDAAGWRRGADGIRAKGGTRLSLDFASSAGSPDVDLQIEIIRSAWQQLGVELNVRHYQASLLFATLAEGGIYNSGKFDVLGVGTTFGIPEDLFTGFACAMFPPRGQNAGRYCNPALDELMLAYQRTYDERAQNEILGKELRIIDDEAPVVVTVSREDVFAFNKDLKNFHPNNLTWFDDMMEVDI
jgi:peptide/nickel transport system substrate-binding protein